MSTRSLGELARLVGGDLEGDPALEIRGFASLESAGPGDLSFVAAARHLDAARRSAATALVAPPGLDLAGRPAIRVPQPYVALTVVLRAFFPDPVTTPGIHPTAHVADSARVSVDATVAAFAVVGERSVVEAAAVVHPHVFVGPDCRVGEGSVLHPHVVLRDRVVIGRRVIVHPGSVLGADGFGYVFDGQGHRKIPQVGRVVVEDDVEIGANVTVDRATLGETVIGHGTKIDNLVQIGHNTVVGADTIIVAQAGVAGSCRIGRRVVLAGQVGIADHVTVGDGAQIGSQAGVHRDVPAGAGMIGTPAVAGEAGMRAFAAIGRLPELLRDVRALGRRMAALERRLGPGEGGAPGG
ncbi:MAG TPA: UDP-3-O-(3-hydroxymyristoyl)glucosamine N-acyltransferase [Methylomirabilota bacterium]|jgi:UDP-3-O-[3-hydroxymyristoyl] glucosamine N-acyltransferase|nr:UDP-3-O-(3-hydroxymyristoyl)glucosamine N-acyltransferase [Methylomirabilota bacterium]